MGGYDIMFSMKYIFHAIESLVNTAEVWRKMLDDFRPAAKAAAEGADAEEPLLGASGFMQV